MAVGDSSLISGLSYLAIGRETTTGTYSTCTAQLDFLSSSIKTTKENKILEQIERGRTMSKRISLMKKIEGDVEFYIYPDVTSTGFMLQQAFGTGSVTSATATGETTSGLAFTHTFSLGSQNGSFSSLCINMRKGEAAGQVFEYSGMKINELTLTGELEEALKASVSFVGFDSSTTSNDISSALSSSSNLPLSFDSGRFSVETTFAALTSSSFWHVQSVEFGINNSLKADNEARRIGSDILATLPSGIASFSLNVNIRFDTTTAYDAMLAETQLAAEFEFLGDTLTTSTVRAGLKLQFPKVFISEAGDPEIGGPDEVLSSNVVFHVLRDDSSETGYAVRALLTNNIASY